MIVSVSDVRKSEQFTMKNESISSLALMERAATVFTDQLAQDVDLSEYERIFVFCGPGNNGGDGLVAARLLAKQNLPVEVVLAVADCNKSVEFTHNLEKIEHLQAELSDFSCCYFEDFLSKKPKNSGQVLVIDALFGIGLSRPLSGYFKDVVQYINHLDADVVAIDVPSGLFADKHTPDDSPCVAADRTYTFQWMKWAFLLPENAERVGCVSVLDIGLQLADYKLINSFVIRDEILRLIYVPPRKYAHKGSNGHGLLFAGSGSMQGAAILAATAALRSGLGKLTVHTPSGVAPLIPAVLPEAIVDKDINENCISKIDAIRLQGIQAIAIGPGIGQSQQTAALLKDLLSEVHSPMVIDADALNLLALNKTWLAYLPPLSILTPHFKEFERLVGVAENDFDRIAKLRDFANKYNVIVILKGAHSVVAVPRGGLFVNNTGNAGMATAGSGDVLTGVLLACLAKGYSPQISALIGVYIHGRAGDFALDNESEESLIAGDICRNLGKAFKTLRSR